jgi:hypothetical protein
LIIKILVGLKLQAPTNAWSAISIHATAPTDLVCKPNNYDYIDFWWMDISIEIQRIVVIACWLYVLVKYGMNVFCWFLPCSADSYFSNNRLNPISNNPHYEQGIAPE